LAFKCNSSLFCDVGDETYLILDQELDTLNGSGCGLGDGSGDTTHCDKASVIPSFVIWMVNVIVRHDSIIGLAIEMGEGVVLKKSTIKPGI